MPDIAYVSATNSSLVKSGDKVASKYSLSSSTKNFIEETDKELNEDLEKIDR